MSAWMSWCWAMGLPPCTRSEGEADGFVEEALREADAQGGDVQPAVGQAGHCGGVAGAFGADEHVRASTWTSSR